MIERASTSAEIYARAPGRIDLLGGGTDPEPFASDYGGLVLNVAIALHTHVTVRPRTEHRVRIHSLDLGREVEIAAGSKFPLDGTLDLPAAMANRFALDRGMDLECRTELPPASGLSSSASLGVSFLAALSAFYGQERTRAEIANLHSDVERFDLKIWGGKQDPFACAHGGLRLWRFEGEKTIDEPLSIADEMLAALERDLLLVYSGEAHLSGNIHNDILEDYRRGKSKVRTAQLRLKELARASKQTVECGDLRRLAELLDENWKAHQQLHPSCSTPRLVELIAAGKASGAWGAKVCGAGGGGCIVFVVPLERRAQVSAALAERGARILPLKFDRDGVQVSRW